METKLKFIEQFIPLMDFDTIDALLLAIDNLASQIDTNKRRNFMICNTNGLMVSFIII